MLQKNIGICTIAQTIPIASDPFIPQNVHPNSVGKMGEFYNYKLSDEKPTLDQPVSDDYARKLIHGYYASISYIDHLIGQILAELKSLDLDNNTMVVLWGITDGIWGMIESGANTVFLSDLSKVH